MQTLRLSIILATIAVFYACSTTMPIQVEEIDYSISLFNTLPDTINECSGFAIDEDGMYVINDGGSGPIIFHINSAGNDTIGVIDIDNAANSDWEAIVSYKDELLVCDFGNNLGMRKDLSIYHVDKKSFTINKEIKFAYPDQLKFDDPKHNFDCEGMVIMEDEYVLFTKNRGNKNSNIYTSVVGQSDFVFRDSIAAPGLVTDACYHEDSNTILLVSYNYSILGGFQCQLTIVMPLGNYKFKTIKSFDIPYKEQIEAIAHFEDNSFLIGSENGYAKGGNLYKVVLKGL